MVWPKHVGSDRTNDGFDFGQLRHVSVAILALSRVIVASTSCNMEKAFRLCACVGKVRLRKPP